MGRPFLLPLLAVCLCGFFCQLRPLAAQEQPEVPAPAEEAGVPLTVAEIAERAKASLVVISVEGRGRGGSAQGSGFVVDASGIIATNLHVLVQARPVTVCFADGREFPVTEVVASNRQLDLALIRIEADNLQALPLALDGEPRQGSRVAAMGAPQGLDFSIVDGVVSSLREIDGNKMIQVAMPIEQGNSGGPLLDEQGRVVGVVTLKSTLSDNIGFAMPSSALQLLIEKPNPITMRNWLTIGTLDPDRWETIMGAQWTQRSGRILVREMGAGFGGRSLCLQKAEVQDESYEVAVDVRLDDEAGAAGLVFASDGGDVHYGFYPTGGRLRLTRFEGPSVYDWTILEQLDVADYRPGEWNRLRVRVEPDQLRCFVNGKEVLVSGDTVLRGGRVGLCKFRQTEAEFARFRVGPDLSEPRLSDDLQAQLEESVVRLLAGEENPLGGELAGKLAAVPEGSRAALLREAEQLAAGAARLREMAEGIHRDSVASALRQELGKQNGGDLARAALLLARLDHPELEIEPYLETLDRMAQRVRRLAGKKPNQKTLLKALRIHLFEEQGFHGSRFDYDNPSNSHLNEVLDDREGIPISLALVWLETGRRAGIRGLAGIGMPGHFVVARTSPKDGDPVEYMDVFDGAAPLAEADLELLAAQATGGGPLLDEFLEPATSQEILVRMLRNLVGVSIENPDHSVPLRYLDLVLALDPEAHGDRFARAGLRYRNGDKEGSREDIEAILAAEPEDMNLGELRRLLEGL